MEVRDPVCGMRFAEDAAAATSEHEGTRYFFCSERCREVFEQDPERYVEPEGSS